MASFVNKHDTCWEMGDLLISLFENTIPQTVIALDIFKTINNVLTKIQNFTI